MASNELTPNSEDRIMCVKVGKVKRENLYEMTLSIGNTRKTRNTLDDVSFWALKTNIPHTLEKMSLLSMARVKNL